MLINAEKIEKEKTIDIAKSMAIAARTAPKACGEDSIIIKIIEGEDLIKLGDEAIKLGKEIKMDFIIRDGNILKKSHCALILGVTNKPLGLSKCSYCGFENCGKCLKAGGHCAIKLADLGIALGSATSVAAHNFVDNRIAFSIGMAAMKSGLMPENVTNTYAIPLHTSGKSIFFDREAIQQK